MVARRRQEGKIREGERPERKTRKPTDKNGAAKRGQTADEDKKQKMEDFVATAGVVPRLLVRKNFALSLQVSAGGVIDCEVFNASLSTSNLCALTYLECVSHSF